MAMATCVLTCRNWFCMSRITCLIIFSGCSALSIRSFRFARTNVETRSSNAMMDSLFLTGQISFVFLGDLDADGEADADAQRQPNRWLMQRLADGGANGSAHECSDDGCV